MNACCTQLESPLPSVAAEGAGFGRLRWRLVCNLLRHACGRARLRSALVVLLSLTLWGILFGVCWDGFVFLKGTVPSRELYEQIVRAVFGMFFASLLVMLVFSAAILLYGALFASPETLFLFTLPARSERVFLHKFQEALVLSSWGFLLLGSPLLVAYGIVAAAPWYYYALLPAYLVSFVYIPAAVGALCCLTVVRRFTNRRVAVTLLCAIGVLALGAALLGTVFGGHSTNLLTPAWLEDMLGRLQVTEQRLLPSWWLSCGLLAAARRQWSESLPFLALLASNALFLRLLAVWAAGHSLRPALDALHRLGGAGRRTRLAGLDRALFRLAGFVPRQMRLLFIKDLRLFRRDPVQWAQLLIFFGLLGLYFLNIRRFTYDIRYAGWVNMVSFLNLSVVGLLLSTFNTRFIFPLVSLEGRRFWILGLLPIRRRTILWSKFCFAMVGCALPSSALIFLSDFMLGVPALILLSHQLTCGMLSCGLSGIAVGLGAAFPHLREQSPARIAAGNGGTLNLVISTAFILTIVLLTALPCHFYYVLEQTGRSVAQLPSKWYFHVGMTAGTLASLAVAALATFIPLRIGFRAFERMEF